MSEREPSQAKVEALIQAAFAADRIDPYEPQSELEARLNRFCFGDTGACLVLFVFQLPIIEDGYNWDIDRADLIEDYVSEERFDELLDGAEPTDEERAWFDSAAKQDADEGCSFCEVAYVYRLDAPEKCDESRSVYFCWIGYEMGQMADATKCVGPLRDLTEVEKALEEVARPPFEYSVEDDNPDLAPLIAAMERRKAHRAVQEQTG